MNKGMGGHQGANMGKREWLTPPEILQALGPFDLDPCAPIDRPWPMAKKHYSILDNGLMQPWFGRVWLNPPYGRQTNDWLRKMAHHDNGIALIFARTETNDWSEYVWLQANAIMFLTGRLHFYHADGTRAEANAGAPSALIAYGDNNVEALQNSGLSGSIVMGWDNS